jgi:hypothetical protein
MTLHRGTINKLNRKMFKIQVVNLTEIYILCHVPVWCTIILKKEFINLFNLHVKSQYHASSMVMKHADGQRR